jgi:hypothetical protein
MKLLNHLRRGSSMELIDDELMESESEDGEALSGWCWSHQSRGSFGIAPACCLTLDDSASILPLTLRHQIPLINLSTVFHLVGLHLLPNQLFSSLKG